LVGHQPAVDGLGRSPPPFRMQVQQQLAQDVLVAAVDQAQALVPAPLLGGERAAEEAEWHAKGWVKKNKKWNSLEM
jgi:hypothetical protein